MDVCIKLYLKIFKNDWATMNFCLETNIFKNSQHFCKANANCNNWANFQNFGIFFCIRPHYVEPPCQNSLAQRSAINRVKVQVINFPIMHYMSILCFTSMISWNMWTLIKFSHWVIIYLLLKVLSNFWTLQEIT